MASGNVMTTASAVIDPASVVTVTVTSSSIVIRSTRVRVRMSRPAVITSITVR